MNPFRSAIGLLGYRLVYPFAEKYTQRDIQAKFQALEEFERLNAVKKAEIQKQRLIRMLRYASTHVPYYRDLFRTCKVDVDKVEIDLSYLQDIPYLTKDMIREHGDRLISEQYKGQFLHPRKTNGSTGESLTVFYSQSDLDWSAAANLLIYPFCGRKMSELEVHLASRQTHVRPTRQERMYGLMKNLSLHRKNVFFTRLDTPELTRIARELKRLRPKQVQGHPSTLYALSLHVENLIKQPVSYFESFESTGETLDGKKAKHISKWLNCKVFNRYGNAEMGVMAHSRDDFRELQLFQFLFHAENHLVSSIECELVMTSLYNEAMPYIRYRTGDLGETLNKDGIPYLRRVHGRVHEFVFWKENWIPTQYFQDILYLRDEVREFQMIVNAKNHLQRVQVVLKEGISSQQTAPLYDYLRDYFGSDLLIESVQLSDLKKTGYLEKFRYLTVED